MIQKIILFVFCQLFFILLISCCATNSEKTQQLEDDIIIAENNFEKFDIKDISLENIITKVNINTPFVPLEFIQGLYEGIEVIRIFPDPKIESYIRLPGELKDGRYYFNYLSSLYSKPISSSDEAIAMVNQQARISYILNSEYGANNKYTAKIQDYRKEGMIKYTLKDADGEFKYGAYVICSAIITLNNEEIKEF